MSLKEVLQKATNKHNSTTKTRRPGAELLGVSCESTSRRRRSSVESMLGLGDSQAISGSLSVPSKLQGPLLGLVAAAEQESTSGRMPDAESQETVNYTIHVAASSASTEDSTVVQETGIVLQWRLLSAQAVVVGHGGYWQGPRGSGPAPGSDRSNDPRFFIGAPKEAKVYGEAVQDGVEKLPIVVSHEFASSDNFGRQTTPSHIEVGVSCDADVLVDPNLLRCWSWCFFFLEMWVSNFCLCLCVARGDWGICFLLSLPHLLLVGMEVELISRDWAFRRNLFTLRRHSPLKAWFFKYIVFAVFGLLSCLPVVRARQCWKQRGMRPSLVDEIEEPSATDSARFDSHVMLVTNVPRIMVLLYASTCLLYSKLQLSILLSMAFLSLVNVLQAAVNFDYYASSWIRRQYERVSESVMFHVLHHSYRLVELALRILTLLGFAVVLRNQALLGVSLLALDYLLGTAALLVVTSLTPGSSSSVLAVLALAFVGVAFVAPPLRVSTPRGLPDKLDRAEPPSDAGAVVMGVLAGVMVALAVPASSWAINDLPEFSVVRPSYMQGVDAALAATKPGEIDFVTRSRIEASYFPQVLEELKQERVKLEAAPSKQERLEKATQQMREYAQTAQFRVAEEVPEVRM
ncbi:nrc-2 [Symbiodinium sp. CCMP2592]|nr:nrc-2 [Symbiodinium sp. CCMP2592]